jgi:ribosome biogenesis GTPase
VELEDLGFSSWYRDRLKEYSVGENKVARIIAVDRDRYMIWSHVGTVPAETTGRLTYSADTPEDMPCVGDWAVVDYLDDQQHAIIHVLLPRNTILRRRAAGTDSAYQPIAANVDVAYIVQSCDVDYRLNRLDRYLVMANDGGITAKLLLTKCDLVPSTHVERLVAEVKKEHRIDVAAVSNITGAGYEQFEQTLERGITYCLLGSSGVGKSTILNRLLGTEKLAVGSVQEKSGKGRHTTTRRQLLVLGNGALFIDTPGMRELGMMAFASGIDESFQDIVAGADECRYANCTHTVEAGCAILAKVRAGQLSTERYQSYLKLLKESEHHEMTNLERRKKDKAFGKMIKNHSKYNKRL